MAILDFLGALVALLVGAIFLNFAEQGLAGRKTYFLHFGFVMMLVVVGGTLFWFWGWTTTAWVLGVAALWSLGPLICQRLFGAEPPPGCLWHGDDPES